MKTPHKGGQRAIYLHPARFQIVACGRRFGKTELGKVLAYREIAKNAGEVWWITPQYKMSTTVWRELSNTFRPMAKWVSAQERTIETKNGGKLVVWSGDTAGDSMRGGAPDLVILDEAAMLKDNELWFKVIMPALSDKDGKAYFLSTPRGRNWFYDLYMLGEDSDPKFSDYKSWRFNSFSNPHANKKAIESARLTTPHKFFEQEYMAKFLTDSGDVFRGAVEISTLNYAYPEVGGIYMIGIDWGKKNDFTVFSVIDVNSKEQVDVEWINKVSYPEQVEELKRMIQKWHPIEIIVEENSIGGPIIDFMIDKENINNITPVYFTNKTKRKYIEQLQVDIENGNLKLLNEPRQVRELQAYQMDRTAHGNIQYNAARGYHDDMVIALSLVNYHVQNQMATFGAAVPVMREWD